jgi:transcriptional regulator with XRE-family HTH domain
MMGSAYPADDIWHPRYRQIRPFALSAAFCELMVRARKAARLTQHALALRLKKPQSFVAKYEGGERRLDVVEFIGIARALGADPLKLMANLMAVGSGKSGPKKPGYKRNT